MASSSSFYFCPSDDCNRKYKTILKLKEHCTNSHSNEVSQWDLNNIIPKENNAINKQKDVEAKEKNRVKKHNMVRQEKEKELLERLELENQRKLEELQKINEKEIAQKKREVELLEKIQLNIEKNLENPDDELCIICFDAGQNTAVTPCGHKKFCYECILTYQYECGHRGCPICRGQISGLQKIY